MFCFVKSDCIFFSKKKKGHIVYLIGLTHITRVKTNISHAHNLLESSIYWSAKASNG